MELERLIRQLVRKRQTIHSVVSRLHATSFPSKTPLHLALMIDRLAAALEAKMQAKFSAGPLSVEDFRDEISIAIRLLELLNSELRFVSRAATRLTPWSLIRTVEKIGEKLHAGSRFVIRPQWQYNYSLREQLATYRDVFSQVLEKGELSEALKISDDQAVDRLYVMGFAFIERLNVLMHSLLGHELGHPIEKEFFASELPQSYVPKIVAEMITELKLPKDINARTLEQEADLQRKTERIRVFRRRAIAELICDLVAVNLFGLAAMFAMEEFALSRQLDSTQKLNPPAHYPPLRLRLRTMWKEFSPEWLARFLEAGNFDHDTSELMQRKFDSLTKLVAIEDDITKIDADPETRIAYQLVEEVLPLIRRFVRGRLEAHGFGMNNMVGGVNRCLLTHLENWIPPDSYLDENGRVIISDVHCILNVGWIRWLRDYSVIPNDVNAHARYFMELDALNRLLLKAIEYVDIRQNWAETQTLC